MKIKSLSECRQQDDLIKIDPVMIITGSEGARGGQKAVGLWYESKK